MPMPSELIDCAFGAQLRAAWGQMRTLVPLVCSCAPGRSLCVNYRKTLVCGGGGIGWLVTPRATLRMDDDGVGQEGADGRRKQ